MSKLRRVVRALRRPEPPKVSDAPYTFARNFMAATAQFAEVPNNVLAERVNSTFRGICSLVKPTVVVEIGAYEASFSRWARRTFPKARVIAYEANPFVYDTFKEEVVEAGVEYVHACVGPENGPVTLNIPKDFRDTPRKLTNQMASLQMNLATQEYEVVQVDGVRLDDVIELAPKDRVILWIDVEGASEQVLRGSRQLIAKAKAIYIEVESEPMWDGQWLDTDVAKYLAAMGFVPIMRDRQRAQQYNVAFVNPKLARDPRIARRAARVVAPLSEEEAARVG